MTEKVECVVVWVVSWDDDNDSGAAAFTSERALREWMWDTYVVSRNPNAGEMHEDWDGTIPGHGDEIVGNCSWEPVYLTLADLRRVDVPKNKGKTV